VPAAERLLDFLATAALSDAEQREIKRAGCGAQLAVE
jgi:hypothetical protein